MSDRDQNWLIGDLSFEYDGHVVPGKSPARGVFEPDERRLLLRDPAAERSFAARLEEVGFHRRTDYRQGEILELLHATCRRTRGPSSGRAGASRPRGSCTARRATSGSR